MTQTTDDNLVIICYSAKYMVDEDALLNSAMLYVQVAMDHNAQ